MKPDLTRVAEAVMERAAAQATARIQRAVEPRHILLAITREEGSAALVLLREVGADAGRLASALDDSLPRRQEEAPASPQEELPYTRRAEEVMEAARAQAREDGRERTGTADLLQALSAARGITRTILHQFGIHEEDVRSARQGRSEVVAAEDRNEEVDVEAASAPDSTAAPDEDAAREARREPPSRPPTLREPPEAASAPEGGDEDAASSAAGGAEDPPGRREDGEDEGREAPLPERRPEADESREGGEPGSGVSRAGTTDGETGSADAVEPRESGWTPPSGREGAPTSSSALEDVLRRPLSRPSPEEGRTESPEERPSPRRGSGGTSRRPSRTGPASLSFLALDPSAATPLYGQIIAGIEAAAAGDALEPGDRLPSIREAADALSVSSGTVARAYRELEDRGVLLTRGTRGTFVARPEADRPENQRIRELAQRLRSPVVAAYHMSAEPSELHRALDLAMRGILLPDDSSEGDTDR